MRIFIVSFAGANELIPQKDIVDFLRENPLAEIGFGVSAKKGGQDNDDRFNHIMGVQRLLQHHRPGKIGTVGLHVNGVGTDGKDGWPHRVLACDIPENLNKMMGFPNTSLQINFTNYDIPPKAADKFLQCTGACMNINNCRVRVQYNIKTKEFIERLAGIGAQVPDSMKKCGVLRPDILFDESYGNGILPERYSPPKFKNLRHIYAGGLGPMNVHQELSKIAKAQTDLDAVVGIDMEGGVRTDDGKTLDLNKADEVYHIVMNWLWDNGR